ncbi:hypothetical protein GN244_ATG18883 [Phytophthora infestans]|uniref:Uncharacterized protein n=1 Tax=Phytophthora infestans TaxID=4787 RepID=A0A833SQF7_PHYIN|nr:hypothetical protein GN244_ATG18883 [Phytophthora infestans]
MDRLALEKEAFELHLESFEGDVQACTRYGKVEHTEKCMSSQARCLACCRTRERRRTTSMLARLVSASHQRSTRRYCSSWKETSFVLHAVDEKLRVPFQVPDVAQRVVLGAQRGSELRSLPFPLKSR